MEENNIVKDYLWNEDEQTLTVYSNQGVKQFCKDQDIDIYNYNYRTVIDPSVEDCSSMFLRCNSFNHPVTIPALAKNCSHMFGKCASFNQPVDIPKSVDNCERMFRDCRSFNSTVNISNSVKNCFHMFGYCTSFNQPIEIPGSVENCEAMFYGCESFNQPTVVPSSVRDCYLMFGNCDNLDSAVIVPDEIIREQSRDGMFARSNKMRLAEQDIVGSLAAKAAKKIYTHQDCQLTAEEADMAKQYKRQKNLVSALGGNEAAKDYEEKFPGALWAYRSYQFMFAEEQKKYAEKSRTNKFASVNCKQTGVDSKSNDKQLE